MEEMIECDGCIFKKSYYHCIIQDYYKLLSTTTKQYPKCPCMECLIKIPCRINCEEFTLYLIKIANIVKEVNKGTYHDKI